MPEAKDKGRCAGVSGGASYVAASRGGGAWHHAILNGLNEQILVLGTIVHGHSSQANVRTTAPVSGLGLQLMGISSPLIES